ncbi:transporter substrate-binding domain-containing protein [Nordella sp. HKS 07]|uniref:transporter substrate-binding domain-containing protein n=1 Tax=Nordella sp. HKS 07 TaxID=2712222 RepID=UPI0013E1C6A5|nr:transporter substrate-binding domain-containing protein [Nordella sp. HKS 07]QIG48296.1 transporter substrate-binding domain-containing protein [Nordella sp. HKS 07]
MRHLTKLIFALLLAGLFAALPAKAADLQQIIKNGVVRIGVPIDVPPFGSVDKNNEAVGLDVDMAKNIAGALGVKLELQQITGANRVPYLATDKLDIVIAAMGATPERALQIAFTSPYAALSIGVFGPDSIAVTKPSELTDQTIAVARGTTQDLELTKAAPNAKIIRFDDDATAAAAFTSGQAQLSRHGRRRRQGHDGQGPEAAVETQIHPAILALLYRHSAGQPGTAAVARHLYPSGPARRLALGTVREMDRHAAAGQFPEHVGRSFPKASPLPLQERGNQLPPPASTVCSRSC